MSGNLFWKRKDFRHYTDLKIGKNNAPDKELFTWAAANDHVIFTHDLDFGAMLSLLGAKKPSVIQVRTQNVTPENLKELIIKSLHQYKEELENGALIVIEENKKRVRILPLDNG